MRLDRPRFSPLSINAIKPQGWLRQQLRIQADGLIGHLDDFWPDIKSSRWFGGNQDGWERAPYWLDGLIPLAYLLNDEILKSKVKRYLDYILLHQGEDGWLGPREMYIPGEQGHKQNYDIWSQFLASKVIMQYFDATGDQRAVKAMEKNLRCIDGYIDKVPLFNWGKFRWFEILPAIWWLYHINSQDWLLELAVKLHAQGFGWRAYFEQWPDRKPTPAGRWSYMSHVVNLAMALKASSCWSLLSHDSSDRQNAYAMLQLLDKYHGLATGVFSGDECLAGKSPTQGTELCAVVEYAFSLEVLISILGDPLLSDRLEKIIFNALPAACTPDMWGHQYDQQVNQVECSVKNRPWTTNGPESNIFGVEPNYGCCTANFGQGWPKFAASLWMIENKGTPAEGLAIIAYAPSRIEATVRGVGINARLETDYPFRDFLEIIIEAERPVQFPLKLRIPSWAKQARLSINDKREEIRSKGGTFITIDREWRGTNVIGLELPMYPQLIRRDRNAVNIERGPLIYVLRIDEDWQRIHLDKPYREPPHSDWEVYPKSAWNYALEAKPETIEEDIRFTEHDIGPTPFSPEGAPVTARVVGREVVDWKIQNGSAGELPLSPVESHENPEELTLIPYGCSNLRIAEFPRLKRSGIFQ